MSICSIIIKLGIDLSNKSCIIKWKGAQKKVKKRRRKLLEEIRDYRIRLEKILEVFLESLSDKDGYEPYERLFKNIRLFSLGEGIDEEIGIDCSVNYNMPIDYFLMDSNKKIFMGVAMLYTFVIYDIFDEEKSTKGIPDSLMNELTDFKKLLEEFLFL